MPYLSPPTLTRQEVESLLGATASHPRDHLIIALGLGTGLRLGEVVGLNVGDVYLPDALLPKVKRFRRYKSDRRERLDPDWGAERLTNLVTAWSHELKEILGALGVNAIESLRGSRDRLRTVGLDAQTSEILGVKPAGL